MPTLDRARPDRVRAADDVTFRRPPLVTPLVIMLVTTLIVCVAPVGAESPVPADATADAPTAAPSEAEMSLGFRRVIDAYAAVTHAPGATITRTDGWTHVELSGTDGDGKAIHTTWSFVPPGHPAYLAAVRRDASIVDGQPTVVTRLLCEATREACDALFESLESEDAAALGNPPPPVAEPTATP